MRRASQLTAKHACSLKPTPTSLWERLNAKVTSGEKVLGVLTKDRVSRLGFAFSGDKWKAELKQREGISKACGLAEMTCFELASSVRPNALSS